MASASSTFDCEAALSPSSQLPSRPSGKAKRPHTQLAAAVAVCARRSSALPGALTFPTCIHTFTLAPMTKPSRLNFISAPAARFRLEILQTVKQLPLAVWPRHA
eukprot:GHVT01094958.1.p2 GENE.GHVT01094958.1~~GHVT01094958.1.p2  ORF type:complete len:104 (+),score=15.68 GHVT01094958.1:215-526(+)